MKKIILLLLTITTIFVSCEDSSNSLNVDTYLLKPKIGVFPENHLGVATVGFGELRYYREDYGIIFSLPTVSSVSLWIVPITSGHDESSGFVNTGGITLIEIESAQPVFILQGEFEAGVHSVDWRFMDENGNHLPSGWYRIYLSTPDYFDYRDKFLCFSVNDCP